MQIHARRRKINSSNTKMVKQYVEWCFTVMVVACQALFWSLQGQVGSSLLTWRATLGVITAAGLNMLCLHLWTRIRSTLIHQLVAVLGCILVGYLRLLVPQKAGWSFHRSVGPPLRLFKPLHRITTTPMLPFAHHPTVQFNLSHS